MERGGFVYMMTNKGRTTIYTGVTSDLQARVYEHKDQYYPNSFTARYNLKLLVYYDGFNSIEEAIEQEKYIKGKSRQWKIDLITKFNPTWKDLTEEIMKW